MHWHEVHTSHPQRFLHARIAASELGGKEGKEIPELAGSTTYRQSEEAISVWRQRQKSALEK